MSAPLHRIALTDIQQDAMLYALGIAIETASRPDIDDDAEPEFGESWTDAIRILQELQGQIFNA